MLSSRLPTVLIARLLLGLLLVCNLTLCISWHGAAAREEATSSSLAMTGAATMPAAMQGLSCHDGSDGYAAADPNQDECQMHGGLTSPMGAGLPLLAALCSLASLGWLGQPLTLFSLFGLLLVTAISVDYAILMREQIGGPAVSLLGTLLAALTTWLSFGLLAVSSTPAVSNFGLSVSLGLAFSFMLAPWAGQQKHAL